MKVKYTDVNGHQQIAEGIALVGQPGGVFIDGNPNAGQAHNRKIAKVAETEAAMGHMSWSEEANVKAIRFKIVDGDGSPVLGDIIRAVFDATPVDDITDSAQAWNWLQAIVSPELQVDGAFATADATATGTTNPGWGWAASEWSIAAGIATAGGGGTDEMFSDQNAVAGQRYTITYTVGVATAASITCGGTALTGLAAGTYTETVEAVSATSQFIVTADAAGTTTIDNVSITNADYAASVDVEFHELTFSTYAAGAQSEWSEWFIFGSALRRADFTYPNGTAAADAKNVTIFAEVG